VGCLRRREFKNSIRLKRKLDVANVVLGGIRHHFETEVAAHRQHGRVFLKHIP
jgi:hypothetical protein